MDILKNAAKLKCLSRPLWRRSRGRFAAGEAGHALCRRVPPGHHGESDCPQEGAGSRVLFAAHMDSIGFIATYIEKEGFVRFCKVGGLHAPDLIATPVRFKNGVRGVICLNEGVEPKEMTLRISILTLGPMTKRRHAQWWALAIPQSMILHSWAWRPSVSLHMDNRISCIVLLMAMEQFQKSENDPLFCIYRPGGAGAARAKTAAYAIDPTTALQWTYRIRR